MENQGMIANVGMGFPYGCDKNVPKLAIFAVI